MFRFSISSRDLAGLLVAAALVPSAQAVPREPALVTSGDIVLELNALEILRAPPGTASIVIGAPAVATVQLGSAGDLLFTGRVLGSAPFYLQDSTGKITGEGRIRVVLPDGSIVLNAGERSTAYACSPLCFPTESPGGPALDAKALASVAVPVPAPASGGPKTSP